MDPLNACDSKDLKGPLVGNIWLIYGYYMVIMWLIIQRNDGYYVVSCSFLEMG